MQKVLHNYIKKSIITRKNKKKIQNVCEKSALSVLT